MWRKHFGLLSVNVHLRTCALKPFSSLFKLQFRTHKSGQKIANAASGHCHNSHTWAIWPEGSTAEGICVHTTCATARASKTWPRTSLISILSLAPPLSPTARLLWQQQRALHQLHATLARNVSTLLEGEFVTVGTKTNSNHKTWH